MCIMGYLRPGLWEILIIFGIILLLFGARKLPKIGKSLGEAIRGFKKTVKEADPPDQTPPAKS